MTQRQVRSSRELDAYHEAGHAVVAWRKGFGASRMSIVRNGPGLGLCYPERWPKRMPDDIREGTRAMALALAMVQFAYGGLAAEFIQTGRKDWVGASDDKHGIDWLLGHRRRRGPGEGHYAVSRALGEDDRRTTRAGGVVGRRGSWGRCGC